MKVLFVYKYLTLGGVETVLRARLDGLDRWGIEAHAWFFHDLGGRRVFAGREDRVHVGDVESCLRLAAEADVLATIDTEEVFPGFAAGARPKLVVECHTPYVENLEYLRTLGRLKPSAVLVPSEHQRKVVLERMDGRAPVLVIPNPLREAFVVEPVRFPVPPRRPVVAWIGRLDDLKNWKGFVELAGKVDAEIWLAGKPVEPGVARELMKRSREAGVLDRLRWFRGLPHDRVPAFLDAVRDSGGAVVSTSKGESFGMTVAEAMARRCAVAAPDRTPFTEFVRDGVNGVLYRSGGAAERVRALLADAGLRARLGQAARESILARYAPEPALEVLARALKSL